MQAISYFSSAIYNSSLLLCPAIVVYWFLKAGNAKQQLGLVIVAANWVLLIAGTIYGVYWLTELGYSHFFVGIEFETIGIVNDSEADKYNDYALLNRMTGPYWWAYWSMLAFNLLIPQLLWFRKIRNSSIAAFIFPLLLNYGLLFERFIIIITSLQRDYLPSSWVMYHPFTVSGVQVGIYCAMVAVGYLVLRRKSSLPPA